MINKVCTLRYKNEFIKGLSMNIIKEIKLFLEILSPINFKYKCPLCHQSSFTANWFINYRWTPYVRWPILDILYGSYSIPEVGILCRWTMSCRSSTPTLKCTHIIQWGSTSVSTSRLRVYSVAHENNLFFRGWFSENL